MGSVKAFNVEHIHINDESVVEAFKQVFQEGFGDVLKQDILDHIEHNLEISSVPQINVV